MTSYILKQAWPLQIAVIFAIVFTRALVLAGGTSAWIHFSKWAQGRQIMRGMSGSVLWCSIADAAKVLLIDAIFTVFLLKIGLFHFETAPSFVFSFSVFAVMFVWVEVYFYYSHRLFHHPKLFWIHRLHHVGAGGGAPSLSPWTSLSFSVLERLVLLMGALLLPALISRFVPLPAEAVVGYFFLNYVLNVYAHLNVETLPNSFVYTGAGKVINTTTYHTMHHMRYRGHFGLFTSTMDRLHGTKFGDYETEHKKNTELKKVSSIVKWKASPLSVK